MPFDLLIISKSDHLYKKRSFGSLLVWGLYVCVLTQCQGGKTSPMVLEKQLLLPSMLEKGYTAIPKQFVSSFYNKEDYSQVENIQDSCQSSQSWRCQKIPPQDRAMLGEIAKHPINTLQTLQASVSMLKIKVFGSRITNRKLDKYGKFGLP